MISGFLISFFGAFQDVATDGMAIDIVPIKEQARANGLMWGSKTIGIALSLVIGTTLINMLGYTKGYFDISYLVAGSATNADYTAGRIVITIHGYDVAS